ncbi:MAG: Beta-barrel assembly-enhancing protease [Syntrophus sp. SKADARSKE-3]|nr:Beta-barrel assembly-enhancing protease [Syntrophus sp. SKADARSKE-3]
MRYLIIMTALLLALSGCANQALQPVTVKEMGDYEPEADEKRIWARSIEEETVLSKSGFVVDDEELGIYLNGIAQKLLPPEIRARIPFKIYALKNSLLNAFAYPNGCIYIHTGILARMDNEAQLAVLLAHEMTHVTHRHAIQSFRNVKDKTVFLATLQVVAAGAGRNLGNLVGTLGAIGTLASIKGYSRENETEADIEGFKLMVNAGYDPREAPKLFIHMKKDVDEKGKKEPFFFGSHPLLQDRIDNFNGLIQECKMKDGVKNEETFLSKTKKLLLVNAQLNLQAGQFKNAERDVQRYLNCSPIDTRAYYLLGDITRQRNEKGDADKAKDYYRKAIAGDATYSEPHKALGLILYKQGAKKEARKYLETYLSLSGKSKDRAYIEHYIKECE